MPAILAQTTESDMDALLNQLAERGVDMAVNAVAVLVILLVALVIAAWVRRWVQSGLMKVHFDVTLSKFSPSLPSMPSWCSP